MSGIELIGLAASISLLSGWRLYLCVFATGLAMRTGWVALPQHLADLDIFANPWVLGISALGLIAEFLADKVMWVDTLWDGIHTLIRPVGGALLAMAIVDARDPAWQVASLLLGGGATLLGHGAKMGMRTLVNMSPEPFSNIILSGTEDFTVTGLLLLALANPAGAIVVALAVAAGVLMILVMARRLVRLFGAVVD